MMPANPAHPDHLDVVIVGAGLSGIGAAVHLQRRLPGKSYAILEARGAIGGTWDLFRYPGVRSDSDMYTLGYAFKPWTDAKAIADGPAIRAYIAETARENDIERHIRFDQRLVAAHWSTPDARWTLEIAHGDETVTQTCNFLLLCSGYYSYERAYRPEWPGEADFAGTIVHPQFWPTDLATAGKRIVVIGSGATAVTLVPELARTAAHVTMLQRSPSYVVSRPSVDRFANWARRCLPAGTAYRLTRAKNILLGQLFYRLARRRPAATARRLIAMVHGEIGEVFDPVHFTPRYKPWDQRLCLVPDADLFAALRSRRASIVTGTIDHFTRGGLVLASGETLPADLVVTATGLRMEIGGGAKLFVDGAPVDVSKTLAYKGLMLSGVPNLGLTFGYTNASWTLKADLTSDYFCRLLARMDRRGARIATPRAPAGTEQAPFLDFTSGYVQRALAILPGQGTTHPWRLRQNYLADLAMLRFGRIEEPNLELR
jgi:monooxygenase